MIDVISVKRHPITPELRDFIFKRDGYICRYCGSKDKPFHLDHVYPVSRGGETTADNLVTSCSSCNLKKHASVGIWPKPTGYFEKKPKEISLANVLIFSASAACIANGLMDSVQGYGGMYVVVARWSFLIGFLLLNVGLLKLSTGK